ncbi:MAG: hypothetical protein AAGF95_21830 [Chloroflexota bacterium]
MNALANQAIANLFIGFGLAFVNVIICYFLPFAPRIISVLRWGMRPHIWIGIYFIALIVQLVTSPYFRSLIVSVSAELAWSPYQALFNVLGIVLMDALVMGWETLRKGSITGRKQLDSARTYVEDKLDNLELPVGTTPEERQAKAEATAQANAERKQRLNERLEDY